MRTVTDFSLRAKTEVRLAYRLRLFLAGGKASPAFAPQNRKSWRRPHLLRKIGKDRRPLQVLAPRPPAQAAGTIPPSFSRENATSLYTREAWKRHCSPSPQNNKRTPSGVHAIEQYPMEQHLPRGKGRRIFEIPRPFFASTASVGTNAII